MDLRQTGQGGGLRKERNTMKVKMNPWMEKAHGKSGDLVFKSHGDDIVVARKSQPNEPNTPAQQAVKRSFKLGTVYGKAALADPATAALYAAKSKETGTPVFALTVADFLNAPEVDLIDLSAYTGRTGDVIRVVAHDDFMVKGVAVLIRDNSGTVLEQGTATAAPDGSWQYTATTNLPLNQHVAIEVSATDLPGNKATKTQST